MIREEQEKERGRMRRLREELFWLVLIGLFHGLVAGTIWWITIETVHASIVAAVEERGAD